MDAESQATSLSDLVMAVQRDAAEFSRRVIARPLRVYQIEPLRAIVESVLGGAGLTFTVMFARQMGKNELSAHLEAFLLNAFRRAGGSIVKAAPTFKPQVINSLQRLRKVLDNPFNRGEWRGEWGYMLSVGLARIIFFSGEPAASVVGATASLLLEIDEAQDFDEEKYQRDFRPMASTTNATTVLYGTAWAEDDLLAKQKRVNLDAESADGRRRHFEYDWTVLADVLPAYRRFVENERARLGEQHPLFATQYALRPLPGAGRLFTPAHLVQLVGEHPRASLGGGPFTAEAQSGTGADFRSLGDFGSLGSVCVAGLDLAGEGEGPRDETVLTLATVEAREVAGVAQPLLRIVDHARWVGAPLCDLQVQLADLLGRVWRVQRVAADATGLGAGVVSFLRSALGPEVVEPVVFSAAVKSRLGYALLAMVGAGRLRMYADDGSAESRDFWAQMRACRREVGASQALRFAVPGGEGHDDFVMSAALCAHAAGGVCVAPAAEVVTAPDVLERREDVGDYAGDFPAMYGSS